MRFVKFKTTSYKLASHENVAADRFQATILKDDAYSIEQILADTEDVSTITVLEDDAVVGVYNGYTQLLGTSIHTNQLIDAQGTHATTISVELKSSTIDTTLNNLQSQITSLSEAQATQAQSTSQSIADLTDGQATLDGAISDLADTVDTVAEDEATLDAAVADLAEAVDALSNPEG